ncbi:MAG TPA: DUF2255 family protein [Acidimicrobiales bacterium]|nr:DUF2255 family protein [Acidimicrobiales bacterium]
MTSWTEPQLRRLGDATEVELASRRPDGSLRRYVTMWIARVGDDLYVRSAGGPERPWYRHAVASGTGHIRTDGLEADVTFGDADQSAQPAIDAAYHAKYDRYGPRIVGSVVGPPAHHVTIRLVPDDEQP